MTEHISILDLSRGLAFSFIYQPVIGKIRLKTYPLVSLHNKKSLCLQPRSC